MSWSDVYDYFHVYANDGDVVFEVDFDDRDDDVLVGDCVPTGCLMISMIIL